MRIFTRYIWHEVLSHAFLGGALFTFVLFMKNIGDLLEMAVRNSASLGGVAKVFVFLLPNTLTLTIPMAVLVGVLLGLSRLSADSEITAMRAVGIGAWFFVKVVSAVALIAWGISLADSLYVAPKATAALLQLKDELKNQQASFEIQPRVFYEDFKNYVLYVQDIRAGTGAARWQRIFLADLSDPVSPKITTAEEALVANGGPNTLLMRLRSGTEHEMVTTNGNPQPLILNPPPKQHYTPLKLQNQPKNHNLFKPTTHSNPSLKIDSIHGGKLRRSKATTHSKRTPVSKSHNRQQQT